MDKHYQFTYKGIKLDPYRILKVYGISDPAQQHAIKKLLRAGESVKPLKEDIKEVILSLTRWLEMLEEDSESSNEILNKEEELDRIAAIKALSAGRRITTLDWADGEYLYFGKDKCIRDENDVIIPDNAFNEIMEDHSVFYIYEDEELVCEEFDVEPLEEDEKKELAFHALEITPEFADKSGRNLRSPKEDE